MAAAGFAGEDRQLVAYQLTAAACENRRAFDKAWPLLLALAGGKSSDAAALWQHAVEDRDAALGSRMGRAQSEADFGDDAGAEEEVSAESIGKTAFPDVALARDAKPVSPGAARKTVDQN